jgi:hypothetical protein
VIDEAAAVIAVTLLHKAYEHLPPERVAGAVSLANLEPLEQALKAITLEAYSHGLDAGVKRGRRELEREMEDDWRPIAERVRAGAGRPSQVQLQEALRSPGNNGPEYTGGPVEVW